MRFPVSLARVTAVCALGALVACGGSGSTPVPGPTPTLGAVPAVLSTDLAVGENRLLLTLLDGRTGRPVARPDDRIRVAFYDLSRSADVPRAEAEGVFLWANPGELGVFAVPVRFSAAGAWEAEVRSGGAAPRRVAFEVRPRFRAVAVAQPAPPSPTRTLSQVQGRMDALTTDPRPAPRFYRTSIRQAVEAAIPFVVVFGSPRHCSSAGCAHMLDVAKRVAAGTTELTFIHVELYRDPESEAPERLDPAVGEWGLPSEPWLYVVGADGIVTARYELAVTQDELEGAIQALY